MLKRPWTSTSLAKRLVTGIFLAFLLFSLAGFVPGLQKQAHASGGDVPSCGKHNQITYDQYWNGNWSGESTSTLPYNLDLWPCRTLISNGDTPINNYGATVSFRRNVVFTNADHYGCSITSILVIDYRISTSFSDDCTYDYTHHAVGVSYYNLGLFSASYTFTESQIIISAYNKTGVPMASVATQWYDNTTN